MQVYIHAYTVCMCMYTMYTCIYYVHICINIYMCAHMHIHIIVTYQT